LLGPKTTASRPITDRVKESLFNVLYKYDLPSGAVVADLFCGVGSLGLEALSRGAEFVTFVEQDRNVISTLNRNIEKAGFAGESKVIRANAFKIGAPVEEKIENLKLKIENFRYDLVFVDPPYAATKSVEADTALGRLLDLLGQQVAAGGIVIVRTEQKTFLLDRYGEFQVIERRRWGTMMVTILSKNGMEKDKEKFEI